VTAPAVETTQGSEQAERYGRYEIVRKLASGGMGEVYLARSVGVAGFQKYVVIKKILPHLVEQPQFVEGLVREAKLLVMLDHPNIVQVLDLGVEGKDYFMAMEFVNGYNMATIAHYCAQKRVLIPANAVINIALGVLDGLEYAHSLVGVDGQRQNIIHRDVSPQNVMISRDARVKLTDFGIAKVLNEAEGEFTQSLKGKFRYMAPEAVDGGRIDRRYDVFAAGILLFEGLCRRHLFGGRSDVDILNQVREARVPSIERYHPGISEGIVAVAHRALERDPSRRFQSAGEFARELREALRPATEAEAGVELRDFIADLYDRDDYPINKPKLPDLRAVELDSTRSLVLRSHIPTGERAVPTEDQEIVRRKKRGGASPAIVALAVGLLAISGVVAYLAYTLWSRSANGGVTPLGDAATTVRIIINDAAPTPTDAGVAVDQQVAASKPDLGKRKRPRPPRRPKICPGRKFTSALGKRSTRKAQRRISACIQRHLKPGQAVKLRLVIDIKGSGKVSKVTVTPAAEAKTAIGRCLAKVAKRIRFPCHDMVSVKFTQPIHAAIGPAK
jgi:serine/threonine protein kinase